MSASELPEDAKRKSALSSATEDTYSVEMESVEDFHINENTSEHENETDNSVKERSNEKVDSGEEEKQLDTENKSELVAGESETRGSFSFVTLTKDGATNKAEAPFEVRNGQEENAYLSSSNVKYSSESYLSELKQLSQNLKVPSNLTFETEDSIISPLESLSFINSQMQFSQFSLYETQIIINVISEVFCQLKLVRRCLPFPMFNWKRVTVSLSDYLNKIMGHVANRIFTDYHEYEKSLLWKLQIDLYDIGNILYLTSLEVGKTGSYGSLLWFLDEIKNIRAQESVVVQENVYLRRLLKLYRKKFIKKEAKFSERNTQEEVFDTEEEKVFDCKLWLHVENRYVEAWEKNRRLQNTMKIEKEENVLINSLKDLSYGQRNDNRVTNEIENYLSMEIDGLESQLSQWTDRYNSELEDRDIELTQMYAEKESIDNRMKNMLVIYNERDEVVQEIKGFFREKEREEEEKFQMNKAATIIQKWWKKYRKMKRKYLNELKVLKKLLKEQKKAQALLKKRKKV